MDKQFATRLGREVSLLGGGLRLGHLLHEHLLHNLLLLNKERTHNAVAHALRAHRTAVSARHSTLALRHLLVLLWPECRDLEGGGEERGCGCGRGGFWLTWVLAA